jgi:hypothetical protein
MKKEIETVREEKERKEEEKFWRGRVTMMIEWQMVQPIRCIRERT